MCKAILVVSILCLIHRETASLSSVCNIHKAGEIIADCRQQNLTEIPPQIPNSTSIMLLSYNFISRLGNSTFLNWKNLTCLDLSHNKLVNLAPLTFAPLHRIDTIDLSYNEHLTFKGFSVATFGLEHVPIRVLKLDFIHQLIGTFVSLKVEHFRKLKNSTLQELHITGNGIIDYEKGFMIKALPKDLKKLIARWNKFYFGSYLFELVVATSLCLLDVSHNDGVLPIATGQITNDIIFNIMIPRNLETAIISFSCLKLNVRNAFHRISPNNLKNIDVSNNYLRVLDTTPTGFEKVERWDLSNNIISYVRSQFFSRTDYNSVHTLNMSNNLLGYCITEPPCSNTFQNLSKLVHLDLSRNRISVLPAYLLQGNPKLEVLNLSNNMMRKFDINFKHLTKLETIDLTNNQLSEISQKTINQLEQLKSIEELFLKGNPFWCTCQNLHFVHWMKKYQTRIMDINKVSCQLIDKTYLPFTNSDGIITKLQKECNFDRLTLPLTLSFALMLASAICLSVGYRYRWKIRYLYHIGRQRYTRLQTTDEDDYEYDAFISYADSDRSVVLQEMIPNLEEDAGLKLCIHQRDFLPGEVIASNIVNAIQNSRKTLILLSSAFLKSAWCEFEYQMARMEGVTRRQNVVIVIMYEPVATRSLPKDMVSLLSTNCYLEYNTDQYGSVVFWQKLAEAINSVSLIE